MNRALATLASASMILVLSSQSLPTAREQLTSLRRQAHAARESGDKLGYLHAALKVQALLNNAPNAVESVARAYAEAGDATRALAALAQFANMGQVDESLIDGSNKAFASLTGSPGYKTLREQFARNKAPISNAELALMVPDAGIVAEDIDYDPQSQSFLITSVLERKIIRITLSGTASDFAESPSRWPMLAMKIDRKRNLAWSTEVALDGFTTVPKSDWGRSAVLCFDLASGKLLRRIEGPPHSALGDLALTQSGDLVVSDGEGGGVYRVRNGELTLINGKDFISPQTSALLTDGIHVAVPDYLRGIGILDLRSGQVHWLNAGLQKPVALSGIDGLYFQRSSLILTQNGTAPERVIRVQLDKSFTRILSTEVIEESTPTLGDPTHGVIVGDTFYYIANSGWSELDDHGDVKPGSKLSPARIMRFRLH